MSLKDTEDSDEFGLHGEGTGNLFQSSILLHSKMCNRKVSKVKHGFVCKEELQGIESSDLKIFPGLEKQLLHNLKGKRQRHEKFWGTKASVKKPIQGRTSQFYGFHPHVKIY